MGRNYTKEDLDGYSKEMLITLFLSMQEQVEQVNQNMERLIEQIACAKQQRYGRHSEKLSVIEGQLNLFNEMEQVMETLYVLEPEFEDICPKKTSKKRKGKREEDIKGLPVTIIRHALSEEELREQFGEHYKQLPDEVYKRLKYHPATYEVEEHHVEVYAGMDNQTIVKAKRPASLLRNSIITPSLEASILNGKYVNALPLYRMEQEFKRNEIHISRQVMSNWTIQCCERYLSLLYDRLHERLFSYHVLQADETFVEVSKDGRVAGSKSYMWIYRTGKMYEEAIVLYDYQKTRKADHPRSYLKGFTGVVVTDGYEVYHKLEREEELKVAGCWSHARRKYAEALKSIKNKENVKNTIAYQALSQIGAIYQLEKEFAKLSNEERQQQRNLILRPLVEAYFAWVKEQIPKMEKGKTLDGLNYSVNQEKYLKVFLEDGEVPMDNNAAEQSIRGFCIGRKNWILIDTIDGAKASAIAYSIAETAKANHLNPYEYYKHLLTVIPEHMEDKNLDFLDDLLPWSKTLPEACRQKENT